MQRTSIDAGNIMYDLSCASTMQPRYTYDRAIDGNAVGANAAVGSDERNLLNATPRRPCTRRRRRAHISIITDGGRFPAYLYPPKRNLHTSNAFACVFFARVFLFRRYVFFPFFTHHDFFFVLRKRPRKRCENRPSRAGATCDFYRCLVKNKKIEF